MATTDKKEIWMILPDFQNYEISNRGRVRSKNRKVWHKGSQVMMNLKGKVMKQRWNKVCKCYFLDLINEQGKRKTVYPHKETAKLFVENPDASLYKMIVHKDNNPRNNRAENLVWLTTSEHMKWQFEHGNKNNFKVWKTRKKLYKNGFKPDTLLPGRPKKEIK